MVTETSVQTSIPVKGSDKLNIADLSISEIGNYEIRPMYTFPFFPLSLRGMMHAYFTRDGDAFLNPEYRKSVKNTKSRGERSSSYIQFDDKHDRGILYHNVEGLFFGRRGPQPIGGEKIGEVFVPEDNWILDIDFEQGMIRKTGTYEEAKERFGDDASYLGVTRNGLRNVSRFHGWVGLFRRSPFSVDVHVGPEGRIDNVGVRLANSSTSKAAIFVVIMLFVEILGYLAGILVVISLLQIKSILYLQDKWTCFASPLCSCLR